MSCLPRISYPRLGINASTLQPQNASISARTSSHVHDNAPLGARITTRMHPFHAPAFFNRTFLKTTSPSPR
ncbi:hypothetical protein BC826DRAFT_1025002 [Russula brevipes]|nr:hypothetical protein BC826DRAFT_1025002 [Russula brevipes]